MVDVAAVCEGDVVVRFTVLVLQELLSDLTVETGYLLVKTLLLRIKLIDLSAHVHNLSLHFRVLLASHPPYGVLMQLLDVIDALEYIGNVVNAPLLNS